MSVLHKRLSSSLVNSGPAIQGDYHFAMMFGLDALRGLKESWNKIVSHDPLSSGYTSWNVMWAWLENLATDCEVVTLVINRSGQTEAIIPFFSPARKSFLSEKRLQMVCFDTLNPQPTLSEEPVYAMTSDEDESEIIWVQIAEYLHIVLKAGDWDTIAYRRWTRNAERANWSRRRERIVEVREYQRGSEIVELPETWDAYKKQLSKSMRENLPYYPRKIEKDGHQWQVRISAAHELNHDLSVLKNLHVTRVNDDPTGGHRNYLQNPRKLGCLADMCLTGNGFVANLEIDGRTVASQIFVRKQESLLVLHSGFLTEYSKYSPLFILQSVVFKDALESGVRRLNLLRGNAQWQNRWSADAIQSIENVTVALKHPLSQVRQFLFVRSNRG
jgi:Acetyltransferase (GNAT) domain